MPFEMVDEVLEQKCRVQRRVRDLPARVVVYLLLTGCLFAELGYGQVWRRLAAGLGGLPEPLLTLEPIRSATTFQPPQSYRYLSQHMLHDLVNGHPASSSLVTVLRP